MVVVRAGDVEVVRIAEGRLVTVAGGDAGQDGSAARSDGAGVRAGEGVRLGVGPDGHDVPAPAHLETSSSGPAWAEAAPDAGLPATSARRTEPGGI
ncbi:hypothetical protein [Streptomyces sp. SID12488]|uniref:hypothetical protein n=1 Tax=Streptomyces sp. SID12488 TaxID=2706040 RepID=UPI0013DD594A|nr:hypothetical protein [Streptomyces sp. SID12488]NEA68221.1 hypothetical protein [Streptomyces sp. SID12488]